MSRLSENVASLKGSPWLCKSSTQSVFAAIAAAGGDVRGVGGAVRNSLLGRPVDDIDLATTLTPDAVIGAAQVAGLKAVPTGVDHGTVTVVAEGEPFEVTTLREDVDTFGRHADVVFGLDWGADAARRDFTLNALYVDAEGVVFDPLGGYEDLVASRVRFIGGPRQRIQEDYLRILRFFRFTAVYGGGVVEPSGLEACVAERAGLASLSAERVRGELFKLLLAEHVRPVIGVMHSHGVLASLVDAVPMISAFGKMSRLEAACRCSADAVRRLGALFVCTSEDAVRLGTQLRLAKAETRRLKRLVPNPREWSGSLDERGARAMLYWLGEERFVDQLLVAWSRCSASPDDARWRLFLTLPERWTVPTFTLSGHDLQKAGIADGRQIGALLTRLENWWVEEDFPGERLLRARLAREAEGLKTGF